MQPRKSWSAAASSACWMGCFPLIADLPAPFSPRPLTPARQLEKGSALLTCSILTKLFSHFATTHQRRSTQYVGIPCMRPLGSGQLDGLIVTAKMLIQVTWLFEGLWKCPYHEVSGCGSGPEARVCQPRWIEEPAAQAWSTPSLAGSDVAINKSRKIFNHEWKYRQKTFTNFMHNFPNCFINI